MLRNFRVDLHIHTCLSPCGDLAMLPTGIVRQARMKKLDIIGISDHNSSENAAAVRKAGEKEGIYVVGGMEVASREEAHVLAVFDDPDALKEIQGIIYNNLPGENDEKFFGKQIVVDENDEITGINSRLLMGASDLTVEEIVQIIHRLGGLAIASHVDKEMFSVISQLGFIPENTAFDALELSPNYRFRMSGQEPGGAEYKRYGFPHVSFSDAHYLEDIGRSYTYFVMEEPNIEEMRKALRGIGERSVRLSLKHIT